MATQGHCVICNMHCLKKLDVPCHHPSVAAPILLQGGQNVSSGKQMLPKFDHSNIKPLQCIGIYSN